MSKSPQQIGGIVGTPGADAAFGCSGLAVGIFMGSLREIHLDISQLQGKVSGHYYVFLKLQEVIQLGPEENWVGDLHPALVLVGLVQHRMRATAKSGRGPGTSFLV